MTLSEMWNNMSANIDSSVLKELYNLSSNDLVNLDSLDSSNYKVTAPTKSTITGNVIGTITHGGNTTLSSSSSSSSSTISTSGSVGTGYSTSTTGYSYSGTTSPYSGNSAKSYGYYDYNVDWESSFTADLAKELIEKALDKDDELYPIVEKYLIKHLEKIMDNPDKVIKELIKEKDDKINELEEKVSDMEKKLSDLETMVEAVRNKQIFNERILPDDYVYPDYPPKISPIWYNTSSDIYNNSITYNNANAINTVDTKDGSDSKKNFC